MIKVKNVYHMLAYSYKILKTEGYSYLESEDFENSQDLLATVLANGVNQQVKRGLDKQYIDSNEILKSPKGKINFSKSIKLNTFINYEVFCEIDRFFEDTMLNQILKTTIFNLSRSNDVKRSKGELKKLLFYFNNVKQINLHNLDWSNIQYDRNNKTYELLICICYLAYEELFLLESDVHEGGVKIKKIHDSKAMAKLYEKFLLEYYRKHFPHFKPSATTINWNTKDFNDEYLPNMYTDVVLQYNNKKLVIDAKYYKDTLKARYKKKRINSENLYQIFAYVKNLDTENQGYISGLLLYAKSDDDVDKTYIIDKNTISVKTLDLDQDFKYICQELDNIISIWLGVEISQLGRED